MNSITSPPPLLSSSDTLPVNSRFFWRWANCSDCREKLTKTDILILEVGGGRSQFLLSGHICDSPGFLQSNGRTRCPSLSNTERSAR